jgi:cytochrome P450
MWMLEIPDRVLSAKEAHDDLLYSEFNFLGADDEFSIGTIHKHLPRNLVTLIPGVQEEIEGAMEAVFGSDTETWKEVNVWEAFLGVVPRVTNKILIGSPICRNKEFLDAQTAFADAVVTNSFFLNMFPKISHRIVGPLISMLVRRHWKKATKIAGPSIEERLHGMRQKAAGDAAYETWEPEEGLITWLIRQAMAEGRGHMLDVATLSKLLLPVEFAAIHTTLITLHSLLLDLLSSDPSRGYLEVLREETDRVFQEEGGHWTKQGLARLYRTDSAMRESMRVSHFATSLVHRKVVDKQGITNPAEGWHAPYGSYLMLHLACLHHDPDLYPDPDDFDAFRFSRVREAYEARPADEKKNPEEALRIKRLVMTATSDTHMAFGHSRHACPGRFFVAHEMKMILAHLLRNYEVQHIAERPKPSWIGQTIIPPLDAKMKIRRRKSP